MRQSLSVPRSRTTLPLLYSGAVLTALITVLALIDPLTMRSLARHVQVGYPTYSAADSDAAASLYIAILVTVGVLGIAGWITTAVLVHVGRQGVARWLGVGLFLVGLALAVTGLSTRDTSGTVGLAPLFGWLLLVPCAAGAIAIVTWRRASARGVTQVGNR